MKRVLSYVLSVITFIFLLFAVFLAYMTVCDYRPDKVEVIRLNDDPDTIKHDSLYQFLTWNIGYAGLDKNMDFFYDGGSKVRPSMEQVKINEKSINHYLSQNQDYDFVMIEEIDKKAKRSYGSNQVATISNTLNMTAFFGLNYNVKWVPIPVFEPMGGVESGVCLFTRKKPTIVERYSYPVNFSWPLKVFMLDRCFVASRYPMDNGKELLVIVTHNSAFDGDGTLRKSELNYLSDFLMSEYLKGNYVVIGGDFNQCPVGIDPKNMRNFDYDDFYTIPDTLLPSWTYAFDVDSPTNRRVVSAYLKEETLITLIDFFIISPNVELKRVKTDNLEFENSDHNPVKMTIAFK